jgi:hypothetical protein
MTRHPLFFLVKKIDNGAVIVGLSLCPNGTLDDGIQTDENDIYGRPGKVETFTIRQSTMEKKRFLWHRQRRRNHIDAIFGRKIDSRKITRTPFDN